MAGRLFLLVGPSGVGKNAILELVRQWLPELRQLPTVTTRPPRKGEVEGIHHYFVSLDRFHEMLQNGELLEHQEVHPGKWYGVPRYLTEHALNSDQLLIADVDIFGAQAVKAAFAERVLTIFILPPSISILKDRILKRGEIDPKELEQRLARATFELTLADNCDYQVVNDILELSAQAVAQLIESEIVGASNMAS